MTGALVHDGAPEAFADGLQRVLGARHDRDTIRGHAERFSVAAFKAGFARAVDAARQGRRHAGGPA